MSQEADILIHFSDDLYKQRMTVRERAVLMIDMYESLDYDLYNLIDKNGKYAGRNLKQAMKDLKNLDIKQTT